MAHFRKRHIETPFEELIRYTRILGILGHRQVGKTTFIRAHSNEYISLDEREALLAANADPVAFIANLKARKSAIDECQLAPGLFPALKIRVGTHSTPGQFILSGSVRFTSREAIRESLTGRIANLEIYPLTLSELDQDQNADFFVRLLGANSLQTFSTHIQVVQSLHKARNLLIEKYAEFGGLPGLCFIRKIHTRNSLLKDLLETILDRDVRLVYPTTLPYQDIRGLCVEIAKNPGKIINHAELQRTTGVSVVTQKKLLRALESVFLIRRIPVEGDYRGDLFWFEDQTERHHFADDATPDPWDWTGLVYRNARAQFGYRLGEYPTYLHYRTRGGAQVPLVICSKNRRVGIFTVDSEADIDRSRIRSAESFLKKYESARIVFLLRSGKEVHLLSERMLAVPMSVALFK